MSKKVFESKPALWAEKISAAEAAYQSYYNLIDETRESYKLASAGLSSSLKVGSACSIFWSGIETQKPFLYFKQPKPCVDRINKNYSPAEALACRLMERLLAWDLSRFDFDSVAKYARNDFLISGCGILWESYKPEFTTVLDEQNHEVLVKTGEKVVSEYVDPKNFLADTDHVGIWEDVTWVARKHFLSAKALLEAFASSPALLTVPVADDDCYKEYCVYEIWDKEDKKVRWWCKDFPDAFLREVDDPFGLENFFPCPKPVFATQSNDSIIPVPDFCMIKADLEELSGVIDRMSLTMKALKVTGAYDSSFPHLADILNKDVSLVAVQDFDKLKSAGGLKGIVDFMPVEQYISALQALALRRDDIIENIYRITGISDIMRGTSSQSETATAVKQKTNFGTLRNQDRQNDMQRFLCDLYALKAEIICEQFATEHVLSFVSPEEKNDAALVQAAVALLKTDKMRNMVLSIETDAVFDQESEASQISAAVKSVSQLIQDAFQIVSAQPALLPLYQLMAEALTASMPKSRSFESVLSKVFDDVARDLAQPEASSSNSFSPVSKPQAASPQQPSFSDQLKLMELRNTYELEKEQNALKARELALKEKSENVKLILADKDFRAEALKLQAEAQKSAPSKA